MDLEIIVASTVSQTKANTIHYHLYVESNKNDINEHMTKQKSTCRHRKQTYSYQRGKLRSNKLGIGD